MGQYYRPHVIGSDSLIDDIEFPENCDLTWISKLHLYDEQEILQINEETASKLGCSGSELIWIGDYGTQISAQNGRVAIEDGDEEWAVDLWDRSQGN